MPKIEIYLEHEDDFLKLPLHSSTSTGYPIMPLPSWFTWWAPFQCEKCGQITIIEGEIEAFQSLDRQMGTETLYGRTEDYICQKCENTITIDVTVSHYTYCWDCEVEVEGATPVFVDFLEDYIKKLHKQKVEFKQLKSEKADLESRFKTLLEHVKKTGGYVLIVEGKDEKQIWSQFARRTGIDVSRLNIAMYGKGGLDEAIKLAKQFKGLVLKSIPHKLVIDSDNEKKEKIEKLRRNEINQSNYHILEKKEIESYLMDAQAISQVLSVSKSVIEKDLKTFGMAGKEQLDALFKKHSGTKATSSVKGLIARAIRELPFEITEILREIEKKSTMIDEAIEKDEEF